ncbi:hypothetical protein [Aminobacterium mobile]|uniref:hypothetical protein n=1 Tax=Aminobacterium mobile TaxID=81467 RepID=UPI002FE0ADA8
MNVYSCPEDMCSALRGGSQLIRENHFCVEQIQGESIISSVADMEKENVSIKNLEIFFNL